MDCDIIKTPEVIGVNSDHVHAERYFCVDNNNARF